MVNPGDVFNEKVALNKFIKTVLFLENLSGKYGAIKNMNKDEMIAKSNDDFRMNWFGKGKYVESSEIKKLSSTDKLNILGLVKTFKNFNERNDPSGEHNLGIIEFNDEIIVWKISYFYLVRKNKNIDYDSCENTFRILNVMLADEYI